MKTTIPPRTRETVSTVLRDYDLRVGYRELGAITHFSWVDDDSFWVYRAGPKSDYDRCFERRQMFTRGGWGDSWEIVEVKDLDLSTLLPISAGDSRLAMQYYPPAIVFGLLEELAPSITPADLNHFMDWADWYRDAESVTAIVEFVNRFRDANPTPCLTATHPELSARTVLKGALSWVNAIARSSRTA